MINFIEKCNEKTGVVIRSVRQLQTSPKEILYVYDKLRSAPRSYGGKFTESSLTGLILLAPFIWRVDDVGLLIILPSTPRAGDCHLAFWDGKLRGREALCRKLALNVMEKNDYDYLWAKIPVEARTVRAFVKRFGFQSFNTDQTHETLVFMRSPVTH